MYFMYNHTWNLLLCTNDQGLLCRYDLYWPGPRISRWAFTHSRPLYSPISRYRHESEDAAADRDDGDEGANLAIDVAEGPVTVQHVHKVERHVQGGHHSVGDAQVHCKNDS